MQMSSDEITSFEDLGLAPEIMAAINQVGYTTPTPIQAQAIPAVMAGRDVLGIAQTGTGKTAGFTLPMINRLMKGRAKARMPRTLILEPTRELAAQVAENFDLYGQNTRLTKALLIGGVSFGDQERAIERGADVLIATPGRLLDHVERGKVMLRGVEVLVIDEADRMLDMGFIPDIERIVKLLPFTRQTLFFSATMPPEITRLSEQFLQAPKHIEVAPPSSTNKNVSQTLIEVAPMGKRAALRALFDREEVTNGIIFCNRKRDIGTLLESLQRHGYSAVSLHGDMDQHIRLKMLDEFKTGSAKYLIASDVAARGLDIPDVSHVFNFDVPSHAEDYVHRIGRTGRAGRTGAAFMLATRQDDKYVQAIQELIKQEIPREELAGLDTAGSEKPAAKAKPRRRKSDAEAKDAASSGGNGAPPSGGNGEGRRRGLLGRNKRKNPDKKTNGQANGQAEAKPLPEKAQKAEAPAKPEKTGRGPRKDTGKDTGKAKNQSSDAFDGNMPDFLKKQIK
jgi:superfamily II DNA/RNA helicase